MKRAAIHTFHLYGLGGGARAVAWFSHALLDLGYQVDIFTSTEVPIEVRKWLPRETTLSMTHPTCGLGYDLLLNIDHFNYAPPLAKLNWAHIFQPNDRNRPPEGFELWTNSKYTAEQSRLAWEREAKHIYIPIAPIFTPLRKEKWIAHCSRIVRPTRYADKGHRQIIMSFLAGCEQGTLNGWELHIVGSVDPRQEDYLKQIMGLAEGYPVRFHLDVADSGVGYVLGRSAFYWHMTGITMKMIPGAQEHFGLTIMEAMAAGAIPISLNTGGPCETIDPGVTGYLVKDSQEVLKTTATLIGQPSLWAVVSEQAQRQGIAWQDYPAFVKRVERMFDGEASEIVVPPARYSEFKEEDVTIILPVYNQCDMTFRFLNTVVATSRPGAIIVVDNNSSDDTPERMGSIQGIHYIRLNENRGFAQAIMTAMPDVKTPLVLTVNNDMECVDEGWLVLLVSCMTEEMGIVGPKLVYPNGFLQFAGGLLDWNRKDIGYHRWYGHADEMKANYFERVSFVTGACLLARKELITIPPELLEGLNYEDTHWCLNAWYQGYQVIYAPMVRLIHYEGATKKAIGSGQKQKISHNRRAFAKLWFEKWNQSQQMALIKETNDRLGEAK